MASKEARQAAECFNENCNLFADPMTEPEKHNLYGGLQNLALAIEKLEDQVQRVSAQVQSLDR